MEDSDVDDPAGEKQHYRPVVPASSRTADAGRGIPLTPKTNPLDGTQKADDAGRFKDVRADETPVSDPGDSTRSRTTKPSVEDSEEVAGDESDSETSGHS